MTLADTDRAKGLVVSSPGLSVRDAVHAAVMLNHDIREIATFDIGFDDVRGVERVLLHLTRSRTPCAAPHVAV